MSHRSKGQFLRHSQNIFRDRNNFRKQHTKNDYHQTRATQVADESRLKYEDKNKLNNISVEYQLVTLLQHWYFTKRPTSNK